MHVASDAEYWQKLKKKLGEEVGEFSKNENIEELADILEALDAIFIFKGFSKREIQRAKAQKAKEKGRFKRRIILDSA